MIVGDPKPLRTPEDVADRQAKAQIRRQRQAVRLMQDPTHVRWLLKLANAPASTVRDERPATLAQRAKKEMDRRRFADARKYRRAHRRG